MKKIFFTFVFCGFVFVSGIVFANELTHAIGDTGYMIREAMHARANKWDGERYSQAIQLQNEAKDYMWGMHKKGRSVEKAMELTKEAYDLAKLARDQALERAQH